MAPPPLPTKDVFVDAIYSRTGRKSDVTLLTERARLGWKIFRAVLCLAAALVVVMVALAWLSYPTASNFRDGNQALDETQLQMWSDARAEWLRQVTTMGQAFLFTSIVPLLGTIAGYLLGERSSRKDADD